MGGPLVLASMPFEPVGVLPTPVVVVPTAANPLPDRARIVDELVAHLRRASDDVVVVDPATDGVDGLRGAGTVAVGGGDPFHLLGELRRTGADTVLAGLVARGATYLGISAGAMVAAPSLAPIVGVSPFTPAAGLDLAGLGLTSTLVLVHHDRPGRAAAHIAALVAHRGEADLVPLLDDEQLAIAADGSSAVAWPDGRWLRMASATDAPGVAAVFGTAARTAWASFLGEAVASFAPTGADWAPRIDVVGAEGGRFRVVESVPDGRIVAFTATRPPADDDLAGAEGVGVGELHLFYASPDVWGTDTARRLHRCALWDLAAAGSDRAVLWTEDRNDRARRFYDRAGWTLDGTTRRREFLGVPIAESRFRLDLAEALVAG